MRLQDEGSAKHEGQREQEEERDLRKEQGGRHNASPLDHRRKFVPVVLSPVRLKVRAKAEQGGRRIQQPPCRLEPDTNKNRNANDVNGHCANRHREDPEPIGLEAALGQVCIQCVLAVGEPRAVEKLERQFDDRDIQVNGEEKDGPLKHGHTKP